MKRALTGQTEQIEQPKHSSQLSDNPRNQNGNLKTQFFNELLEQYMNYWPTNVVTLAAGSVATKALPPTVLMLACSTRFRLADVTQGATVLARNHSRQNPG